MVKPLAFKGDAAPKKKRKHAARPSSPSAASPPPSSTPTAGDDDDTWVAADAASDLAGPVLLVLPPPNATHSRPSTGDSPTITCIACDANGEVFSSALENAIEGADPSATAEPHDVRQVWVASRVAGTGEGVVSLKGHHGK